MSVPVICTSPLFIYLSVCTLMRNKDAVSLVQLFDSMNQGVNFFFFLTHLTSPLLKKTYFVVFLIFSTLCRWSGFLLCAVAMLLVIFPMFTFPKKLPPRHKKKKRRKKLSLDDLSSDDDVLKEKSNNKSQAVTSSIGFGKDIKGTRRGYCKIL